MDIVCIIAAVLITLIPVLSIASQFWRTSKKMVGSRVATSILSIISCIVLLVADYFVYVCHYRIRYKLLGYSLIVIAIFMNWLMVWLQRDERSRKFRLRINICILLANIAVFVTLAYVFITSLMSIGYPN